MLEIFVLNVVIHFLQSLMNMVIGILLQFLICGLPCIFLRKGQSCEVDSCLLEDRFGERVFHFGAIYVKMFIPCLFSFLAEGLRIYMLIGGY